MPNQNINTFADSSQTDSLWNKLANAELIDGEPPVNNEVDSPWFVKILIAFSGWLAACFLLIFLGLVFSALFDSPLATFVAGVALLLAAFGMFKSKPNDFFINIAFALSIVAQILLFFSIFQLFEDSNEKFFIIGLCVFKFK